MPNLLSHTTIGVVMPNLLSHTMKLASSLPVGDPTRTKLLELVSKTSAFETTWETTEAYRKVLERATDSAIRKRGSKSLKRVEYAEDAKRRKVNGLKKLRRVVADDLGWDEGSMDLYDSRKIGWVLHVYPPGTVTVRDLNQALRSSSWARYVTTMFTRKDDYLIVNLTGRGLKHFGHL